MFAEFSLLTPEEEQTFVQHTTITLSKLITVSNVQYFCKFRNKRKYTPYPSAEPIQKRRKTSTIEKKANFLDGKLSRKLSPKFVVQHDEYMQDDTEYHPESEDVVEEARTPMNVIVEQKNKQKAKSRKMEKSVRRSENQSRIFCNHCKTFFYAKPTLRKKKHVFALNHACKPGEKRRQYVLGKKHRKCEFNHEGPCLELAPEWQVKEEEKKA